MRFLNLRDDDVDDAPGKWIRVNGADYVLMEPVGEGGHHIIFPLVNRKTQLVKFVAKLAKFSPASPEFEDFKRQECSSYAFLEQLCRESGSFNVLPAETYEIPGGLIALQRFIAMPTSFDPSAVPAYQRDLVDTGNQHRSNDDHESALKCYQRILNNNPWHSDALFYQGVCLFKLNQYSEAFRHITQAIDVEPNFVEYYHHGAQLFLALGLFNSAIELLQKTLQRWPRDLETTRLLVNIGAEYDLSSGAIQWVERLLEFLPKSKEIENMLVNLRDVQIRELAYDDLVLTMEEKQNERQWQDSLSAVERAKLSNKRDYVVKANVVLCRFQLNDSTLHVQEILALLQFFRGPRAYPLLAVAMLTAYQNSDYDMALQLARTIHDAVSDPWDLPNIPMFVSDTHVSEEESSDRIIKTLEALRIELSNQNVTFVNQLLELYRTRASLLSDAEDISK